jgi:heterodisulfide reductase subunit A
MYSIKQAQLLMGALPLAEITIYYIDIRAFGKGFEEFYQQAGGMGTCFTKGKVAKVEETENNSLLLHYEDIENGGKAAQAEHDLVVLSVGLLPSQGIVELFSNEKLETDSYGYIREDIENLSPGKTNIDGVFVSGSAAAVQDIPDTIIHSGACAAQAGAYIERLKNG